MATKNSTGAPERIDHRVRPHRTPQFHYASMRNAEQSARDLSVQLQARKFLHAVTDEVSDAELADLKAARTSRVEQVVRPVVRGALRVRRAVTA